MLCGVPETRKADAVKEMVAWTYCADIFHGLSDKQRRQICLEARGEAVEENGTRVKLGLFPKAWVRRLPDWRWVIANINIVLIECDPEEPFRFPIPEEHFAPQSATQMVGLSTGDSDGSDVDDRWPEGTHPGDDYYDGDLFPYHENGSSSSDEYEDDSGSQSDEED